MESQYLSEALDGVTLKEVVRQLVAKLRRLENSGINFDAIAFRGMSGAIVAGAVALRMDKALILIRKKGDSTHSNAEIEGVISDSASFTYIILDDFIESGSTIADILEIVDAATNGAADCVQVVLWSDCNDTVEEVYDDIINNSWRGKANYAKRIRVHFDGEWPQMTRLMGEQ